MIWDIVTRGSKIVNADVEVLKFKTILKFQIACLNLKFCLVEIPKDRCVVEGNHMRLSIKSEYSYWCMQVASKK